MEAAKAANKKGRALGSRGKSQRGQAPEGHVCFSEISVDRRKIGHGINVPVPNGINLRVK
jgi:hypothetical protein